MESGKLHRGLPSVSTFDGGRVPVPRTLYFFVGERSPVSVETGPLGPPEASEDKVSSNTSGSHWLPGTSLLPGGIEVSCDQCTGDRDEFLKLYGSRTTLLDGSRVVFSVVPNPSTPLPLSLLSKAPRSTKVSDRCGSRPKDGKRVVESKGFYVTVSWVTAPRVY